MAKMSGRRCRAAEKILQKFGFFHQKFGFSFAYIYVGVYLWFSLGAGAKKILKIVLDNSFRCCFVVSSATRSQHRTSVFFHEVHTVLDVSS